MKSTLIPVNIDFCGREEEQERLQDIITYPKARTLVVYGRRRIGKTELLEQTFRKRNLVKFEGIEGKSEAEQMSHVLSLLAELCDEPLLKKLAVSSWTEIFKLIAEQVSEGPWTLYFEELQWLAAYKGDFVAELKYVWDNHFRHNNELIIILCGSSPSFMINQVTHSKALYNRSLFELPIHEFHLNDAQQFMPNYTAHDVMDAILSVGGIPEYLQWLKEDGSVFLSLCQQAFRSGSPFFGETDRIFVSSLANNEHYEKIVRFLAKNRFATRAEIATAIKMSTGGSLTNLLQDLELCGFIRKFVPYHLKQDSLLARYHINDAYLQFYFKFIEPIKARIASGEFDKDPTKALAIDDYRKWLGFSFERFCRRYAYVIARILGFYAIDYEFGAYFSRKAVGEQPGYQIDLLFDRKDRVFTICEIKYLQSKVDTSVIEAMERKIQLFPNPKGYRIQRVLICNHGATESLVNRAYFDRIITLEDLFEPHHW
ncbi:MAG: hypothetical protein CMF50_02195 [Legionellales bacterium]|nr:hypothetical protein [Legionellales bacterium]|tara:strand:- start:39146 stop:40600 length:1455 start_codon:yes stop_codon:yes gene_type:complete